MTMLATINDVEDFKITALLEWVIDIQDFYYEFRQSMTMSLIQLR